jgi:hypothetical protein
MGDLEIAAERLADVLNRARAINLVEEELPALTALAELHRQRKEYDAARDLLDHVWAAAERGPYPSGRPTLATCWVCSNAILAIMTRPRRQQPKLTGLLGATGRPTPMSPGLARARHHLRELGVPEPQLPPFNPTKFPPLPEGGIESIRRIPPG